MDGWTKAKEDVKKKLERRYLPFQLSDCFVRLPRPKLCIHAFGLLFVPGQRCFTTPSLCGVAGVSISGEAPPSSRTIQ